MTQKELINQLEQRVFLWWNSINDATDTLANEITKALFGFLRFENLYSPDRIFRAANVALNAMLSAIDDWFDTVTSRLITSLVSFLGEVSGNYPRSATYRVLTRAGAYRATAAFVAEAGARSGFGASALQVRIGLLIKSLLSRIKFIKNPTFAGYFKSVRGKWVNLLILGYDNLRLAGAVLTTLDILSELWDIDGKKINPYERLQLSDSNARITETGRRRVRIQTGSPVPTANNL